MRRESTTQRSIRLPQSVDAMLLDLIQAGFFETLTDTMVEAIGRLYREYFPEGSKVPLSVSVTKGDYNNLERLAQLEGGDVKLWAQRLLNIYAPVHAERIAEQTKTWDAVFDAKRKLEDRTERLVEFKRK